MDKKVHIYAPLFSPEFIDSYDSFIQDCFRTFTAAGQSAKLRTQVLHPVGGDRKNFSPVAWQAEWDEMFSTKEECPPPGQIGASYENLMLSFSEGLGVGLRSAGRKQEKTLAAGGSK